MNRKTIIYKGLLRSHLLWLGCFFLLLGIIQQPLQAQDLETYLQKAAENKPTLKASYAEFEAAMQRAPQVASLPDPT